MTSPRSEHAEALRSSVERLCQLAAAEDLEKLGVERRKLEQALASLTVEADGLRAERDAARGETRRIELQLTAARQILDDGPDGFIVTDRAGVILQANRAATHLLGVSSRFLVRKPLSLFIDEADLRMFRWRVNNAHVWSHGEWPVRIRPRNGAPFIAGLTVSAFTGAPGLTSTRSTRALVLAAIHWISSGTSVPCPSTSRTMGPRRTVSIQTVPRSTLGAAGRSCRRPTLTATSAVTPATP